MKNNEEILKRFEFDVMTGRLRHISNTDGDTICPFENDNKEDLEFLMKIFKKLGFERNYNTYFTYKNADGISINLTNKTYWFYTLDDGDDSYDDNEIPDYLYEYMEDLNGQN